MDRAMNELATIEEIASEVTESPIRDLNDLQLALVGGGCADPILH
jgi:hypothetical protein